MGQSRENFQTEERKDGQKNGQTLIQKTLPATTGEQKKPFKSHSKNRNHTALMKLRKINTTLPSIFHNEPPEAVCNLAYGTVVDVHSKYV